MNVDERIEALAQSVELMASLQKDRDARIDYLHSEMMLAITRLAHTADAHNGQLDDHEGRLQHLEGNQ